MIVDTGKNVCGVVCRPKLKALTDVMDPNINIYDGVLKNIDGDMNSIEVEIMNWINDSH